MLYLYSTFAHLWHFLLMHIWHYLLPLVSYINRGRPALKMTAMYSCWFSEAANIKSPDCCWRRKLNRMPAHTFQWSCFMGFLNEYSTRCRGHHNVLTWCCMSQHQHFLKTCMEFLLSTTLKEKQMLAQTHEASQIFSLLFFYIFWSRCYAAWQKGMPQTSDLPMN